jgi:hypothetical protein
MKAAALMKAAGCVLRNAALSLLGSTLILLALAVVLTVQFMKYLLNTPPVA